MDFSKCNVYLYIDNSNLFIETQKFAAQKNELNLSQDKSCRVNVEKLLEKLLNGREFVQGTAYVSSYEDSSLPYKPMDNVWKIYKDRGLEVKEFDRSTWTGKEKKVDTTIVADAVEQIVLNQHEPHCIILVTGDSDMIPVKEKAKKYGHVLEIWAYEKAFAKVFQDNQDEMLKINYLDDIFYDIHFYERTWNLEKEIPEDRAILLT